MTKDASKRGCKDDPSVELDDHIFAVLLFEAHVHCKPKCLFIFVVHRISFSRPSILDLRNHDSHQLP